MLPINAVLILVWLLIWWIRSARRKDLPPGPMPLPLIGNAVQLFWAHLNGKSHVEVYKEWRKIYGNVYTMYLGPYHCVIICDYKTTVDAILKNSEDYADRPPFFLFNDIRNDLGVTFAKGPGWLEQRRFSLRTLRDFGFGRNIMQIRILEEWHYRSAKLDQEFDKIGGKSMIMDPRLFTDLLISSIVNRILVGYRYDEDHMREFEVIKYGLDDEFDILTIWDLSFLTKYTWRLPIFNRRWIAAADHQRVMLEYMRETVRKRREEIAAGLHHLDYENGGDDYVDAYLIKYEEKKAKNEFLGWFSDENLAVNLVDLWMAGTETTIEALLWFMIFTLHNMPVQKKLRVESYSITKGNRDVELTDRPHMHYTNAVVTEVLRCASIINFNLIRETTRPTIVGDYVLPKKTSVASQLSVLFKDEEVYADHGKFNPDRYMEDNELTKKVIAFGVGKRSCVGESLARAELFLIISNFVQKYKFSPPDDCPPPTTDELSTLLFLRRTRRFKIKLEKVDCAS